MKNSITLILMLVLFVASIATAQKEMNFRTNKGEKITIETGKIAFADWAWFEAQGTPALKRGHQRRSPLSVLGAPNYSNRANISQNVCSIGCGGALILQFKDNALIDGPGEDLVIFEAGAIMEKTSVSISKDGKKWTDVGVVEGFTNAVDIAPYAEEGTRYHFIKLVDLYSLCEDKYYDGADIDAVAAIHSAESVANQTIAANQVSDRDNVQTGASSNNQLTIFPNPTDYEVNMKFYLSKNDQVTFTVFDQMGKVVKTLANKQHYAAGTHQIAATLDGFPAGTYYILMKTSESSEMKKLIKQQ